MFFYGAKILGWFTEPLNLVLFGLVLSTALSWLGKARGARALLTLVTLAFLMIVITPIGKLPLLALEQRFPAQRQLPAKVDGIVLLGGAQRPRLTQAHGQPALNRAAETMTTFLALARRYPEAKLVFTGGTGDILNQQLSETDTVKLFLREQGFDPARVIYEGRARNTYENAQLTKALVQPRIGEKWILIQAAASIPRAVGVFRKAGWEVIPYPCDFNAVPGISFQPSLSAVEAFSDLRIALHEWAGLVVYFVTGKSSELWPAP